MHSLINNINIIGYFIYRLKHLVLYYNTLTRLCLMSNLYVVVFYILYCFMCGFVKF